MVVDSAVCEDGAEGFFVGLPDFERVFKVLSEEVESFIDRAFLDSGLDAVTSSSSSSQLNNSSFSTDPKHNGKNSASIYRMQNLP